jgi:PAS domain S-box-containing protein
MNSVAEFLTGWNINEAYNKKLNVVFNIINGQSRISNPNPFDLVIKTGKIVGLANNTVLISKDGTERIIADSGSPIRDYNNNIFGVILVFRDETEKHNSIKKLTESEMRFRSIFENARDPILLIDETIHFFDCNDAACKILHAKSKSEIIGKTPEDISPEFQSDGTKSSDKARMMIKNAFDYDNTQFEWIHTTLDGIDLIFDISLSVIPLGNKQVLLTHW